MASYDEELQDTLEIVQVLLKMAARFKSADGRALTEDITMGELIAIAAPIASDAAAQMYDKLTAFWEGK